MSKKGTARFYLNVERTMFSPFEILLDGRPIKTPGGHKLSIERARALADAIADEWRAQGEKVVPETMPLTKLAYTAIDRVPGNRDAVIDDLAKYANSDLLCYRAEGPAELVRRQEEAWDKWLGWAAETYWANLEIGSGIAHVQQSADALDRLWNAIAEFDNHRLTALHVGVTITGSAVLGLAFAKGEMTAEEALAAAEVDAAYQAELWGRDAEAEKARANRMADLKAAEAYLKLLS